jgi:hypothetical protein
MALEFSDAQKQVLTKYGKPHPVNPDVRTWPFQDRHDLFFSYDVITIFLEAQTPRGEVCSEVCVAPRYALAAVSSTFAEHLMQKPDLDTFMFNVGRMDKTLQQEHERALNTLTTWLTTLATLTISDLKAPTFYAEIALRHIARQLGMNSYLTDCTDDFIHDTQEHTLQPWHITELLYASSIEIDGAFPIIMEDNPLLVYLAQRMVGAMNVLWAQEKEIVYRWLRRDENKALERAIRRLEGL